MMHGHEPDRRRTGGRTLVWADRYVDESRLLTAERRQHDTLRRRLHEALEATAGDEPTTFVPLSRIPEARTAVLSALSRAHLSEDQLADDITFSVLEALNILEGR